MVRFCPAYGAKRYIFPSKHLKDQLDSPDGDSRSRSFPRMDASDSLSQTLGMDFFHSLPVPELWEWIFFIPFPFPKLGNGSFSFPSRSRIDHFIVGNQKGKWKIERDAIIPTFSASSTIHTT